MVQNVESVYRCLLGSPAAIFSDPLRFSFAVSLSFDGRGQGDQHPHHNGTTISRSSCCYRHDTAAFPPSTLVVSPGRLEHLPAPRRPDLGHPSEPLLFRQRRKLQVARHHRPDHRLSYPPPPLPPSFPCLYHFRRRRLQLRHRHQCYRSRLYLGYHSHLFLPRPSRRRR